MERQAAVEAARALLAVRPKTMEHLRYATYTLGLVAREAGTPLDEAIEAVIKWRETLDKQGLWVPRTSSLRTQIKQAYRRTWDQPSREWFKLLTGSSPPVDPSWVDLPPSPALIEKLNSCPPLPSPPAGRKETGVKTGGRQQK